MSSPSSSKPVLERYRKRFDSKLAFLREFLTNPLEVASVVPSSRFLEQRIVRLARPQHATCVVEFGAGTGGTTRALLGALAPSAKLLCIELNGEFVRLLQARFAGDPRLIVHHGDAGDVREALQMWGLPAPQVVISGIPFSTIPAQEGRRLVNEVYDCLAPGGRFVAYQLQSRVRELGSRVFGPCWTEHEFRNFPPVRVYCWRKPHVPRGRVAKVAIT